jgi:hypothetical protein
MGENISRPGDDKIPVAFILFKITEIFNIQKETISGKGRYREVLFPRKVFIRAIREIRPDFTLNRIGAVVNRDHATVSHALRQKLGRSPTRLDLQVTAILDGVVVEIRAAWKARQDEIECRGLSRKGNDDECELSSGLQRDRVGGGDG